jgi:acyl-CoA synthetase (AMP-forming)/AMP-acid ligase II
MRKAKSKSRYAGVRLSEEQNKVLSRLRQNSNLSKSEILLKGKKDGWLYTGDVAGTERVKKDGWLYTGDVASMDADGFAQIISESGIKSAADVRRLKEAGVDELVGTDSVENEYAKVSVAPMLARILGQRSR